jgi:hypothetical protein
LDAFLADALAALHLAVVLFMIAGLALVFLGWPLRWRWVRNPWFRFAHLGIMAYIAINAARGELCFLTLWEQDLRERAGQETDEQISFVGRLLRDVLFVETPQATLQFIYYAFGALVLVSLFCVPPRIRAG